MFLQLTSSQPRERAKGVKRVETWTPGREAFFAFLGVPHLSTCALPYYAVEPILFAALRRRTRCRLPVAVDVTASFVEIMLNDAYLNPETPAARSDHELRLMYAMAVVRLVNGIVVAATVVRKLNPC